MRRAIVSAQSSRSRSCTSGAPAVDVRIAVERERVGVRAEVRRRHL